MNYGKFLLGGFIALLLLGLSCASRETTEPALLALAPAPEKPVVSGKLGWEAEWDRTLKEARKEGKVVVYTYPMPTINEFAPRFRGKYGFTLEVVSGRGGELDAKIQRERSSGLYLVDVFMLGLNSVFNLKSAGATDLLEPVLVLPEVVNPQMWWTQVELPWADKDKHVFSFTAFANRDISINSDMVKPEEITSWRDLLNPKWKGKIIWGDPTIAGSAFNGFSTMLFQKVLDLDYYRQMVKQQEIQLTRDMNLMVDWLTRGKFSIAISAESTALKKYQDAGAPVQFIVTKESTYLSVSAGNVVVVNRAAHPHAAKVFINWLLTDEGQILAQNSLGRQSGREGIPTKGLAPETIRVPGKEYFRGANAMEEWVLKEQYKYMEMAKEVFGPALTR